MYLTRDTRWLRSLLRVVRAHDLRKVSPFAVADHLAKLNLEVHQRLADKSVGPRCIVAWRNRKSSGQGLGGGQQSYTGTLRDAHSPSLPTIAGEFDVQAVIGVSLPYFEEMFEAARRGDTTKEVDRDKMNADLARLPDKPDEDLR